MGKNIKIDDNVEIWNCSKNCHDRDMCTDDYDSCPYRDEFTDEWGEPYEDDEE